MSIQMAIENPENNGTDGTDKRTKDMQDIMNVYLELPPQSIPTFLTNDLANLPPITMNNFDVSSIIKDMTSMKQQMKIRQEVQETTLSVHAALCKNEHTLSERERRQMLGNPSLQL